MSVCIKQRITSVFVFREREQTEGTGVFKSGHK